MSKRIQVSLVLLAAVATMILLGTGCPTATNANKRNCSIITSSGPQCVQREMDYSCNDHSFTPGTLGDSPNCFLTACDSCPAF